MNISKTFTKFAIILLINILSTLSASGQAHQATMYVQALNDSEESQIIANAAAIRENLLANANCGTVINIIIATKDIQVSIDDERKTLIGPEYEGNNDDFIQLPTYSRTWPY